MMPPGQSVCAGVPGTADTGAAGGRDVDPRYDLMPPSDRLILGTEVADEGREEGLLPWAL